MLGKIICSRCPQFRMTFSTGNGKELALPLMNIRYIEADGITSDIHLADYSRIKVSVTHSIGFCEKLLEEYAFVRIHRKYLVNYSWIQKITRDSEMHCVLNEEKELPVARRRQRPLLEQINHYQLDHLLLSQNKTKTIINL